MANLPNPDPLAMYFLLVLGVLLCGFFIWISIVLIRLWIYHGALGPQPETFVILPTYLPQRGAQLESPTEERNNKAHSTFTTYAYSPASGPGVAHLSDIPRVNIAAVRVEKEPDSEVREFVVEQQRISCLPAFVQDDCGDGSEFPDIPYATTEGNEQDSALVASSHGDAATSGTNHALCLKEQALSGWVKVDTTHTKLHEARESLLVTKNAECIQVTREGEAACEELLQELAAFLVDTHPAQYTFKTVYRRKHIRNEVTKDEYALVQPFDCHPLEVCARLVNEDFSILAKGEFTQQYYLNASATLSPAGLRTRNLLGKNLAQIRQQAVYQWDDFAEILTFPLTTPLTRSVFYIQTQPDMRPLAELLFIQSSKDFFPGTIAHLFPEHILVRREAQTFRRLRSGAVVFSARTDMRRLVELIGGERRRLVEEIRKWPDDVAEWKGRSLWEGVVLRFCEGKFGGEAAT